MPQEPIDLVTGIYDAYDHGDVAGLLAACDPDIEWVTSKETLPWSQGQYRGREGVAQYFQDFSRYIDDLRIDVDELLPSGDRVVAIGWLHATARGTDRSYRARFAQIWTLRDGLAVRLEGIVDTMVIALAINPELTEHVALWTIDD